VSAATLEKPETQTPTREDGVSGYAVTLNGNKETSKREPVQIVTHVNDIGLLIGIDRTVVLLVEATSNRVAVYSDEGTEMMSNDCDMTPGDTVTLYPVHTDNIPFNIFRTSE
jgi:hypothetical protein